MRCHLTLAFYDDKVRDSSPGRGHEVRNLSL